MADDEGGKPAVDKGAITAALTDWFAARAALALNCKADKFKKLMAVEEASRPVADFWNIAEVTRVFVAEGAKELACFETPPPSQKKKMIYFLKLNKVAITPDNVKEEVIFGDVTPGVLQHLFESTSEVYLPLLTNSNNQQGLPEVVIKDVMEYCTRVTPLFPSCVPQLLHRYSARALHLRCDLTKCVRIVIAGCQSTVSSQPSM